MDQPRPDGSAKGARPEGEEDQKRGRGQREGAPGRQRAQRPASQQAKRETDLARGRAGQELTEGDEIGIASFVDPPAPQHELVPEVAEMGDGSAEGSQAELEEGAKDFAGAARDCSDGRILRSVRSERRRIHGAGHSAHPLTTGW